MARMTRNKFFDYINRMVGNKFTAYSSTEVLDAINHARFNLALRNIDLLRSELEATPAFYFSIDVDTSGTATNTADSAAVTLASTTVDDADIGQLFKFSGEDLVYRITDISSTTAITVSPNIATAHTAEACAIVKQTYGLPDGTTTYQFGKDTTTYPALFHVIDVTDVKSQRKLRAADARLYDKTLPRVDTDPVWYYRSGNNIIIHPVPDEAGTTLQVRYARRLAEITTDIDMDPIPEEFDRVILYDAASYVLDLENEPERSDYLKNKAMELEMVIRSKRSEETEDYDFGFRPRFDYWSRDSGYY